MWANSTKRAVRDNRTLTLQETRAHLTIVFAALAISREIQERTGLSIRHVVRQRRPRRSATVVANGAEQTLTPLIPTEQQALADAITDQKLRP